MMKTFSQLLSPLPEARLLGNGDTGIGSIAYDSRRVDGGSLFVAIPGLRTDGHRYLAEAIKRGAVAVVVQADCRPIWEPALSDAQVAVAVVPESRRALAALAAAFYDYPAQRLKVIGVTGTDGKTTTSYLISHLLEASGFSVGLVGTVGFRLGGAASDNPWHQTTPEAPELQALLAAMVTQGSQYAVIESTSHGLALHRLDGCHYDVAVFTNLSDDHLDFHGTREAYLEAKGRLFAMLDQSVDKGVPKTAVLNADEEACRYLRTVTRARILTYGIAARDSDVRAEDICLTDQGTHYRLITAAGECEVATSLIGRFNVYNCLAATAAVLPFGVDPRTAAQALDSFPGVPGRMQRVEVGQPFNVVVDFAHAPNALRSALRALRPLTRGRLIVLFGCAGERDEGRRPGMGQAAADLADFAVLTSDDPRSENPQRIIDQIARAMQAAGQREGDNFVRIADRREAIGYALQAARPGDTVLLAGKGHERTMLIGQEAISWDEAEIVRQALRD